jgi:hypothetical protein
LEDVMEMPGLEESIADFSYVPEEDDEDEDEASLQYTKKEVSVLKKKLKRVENLIKDATTPQEIKNLQTKLDEYISDLGEEESKLRTLQPVGEESSNHNSAGSLSELSSLQKENDANEKRLEEATRRQEEPIQQQEEEE